MHPCYTTSVLDLTTSPALLVGVCAASANPSLPLPVWMQCDLLCSWASRFLSISSRIPCCAEAALPLSGARTPFCPLSLDSMHTCIASLAPGSTQISCKGNIVSPMNL